MVDSYSKSWCKKKIESCGTLKPLQSYLRETYVLDSIRSIEMEWDSLIEGEDLLFSSDYLRIIEENPPSDITPYYVMSYDNEKPIACFYFQYKYVRLEDNLRGSAQAQEEFSIKQLIKNQCIKSINFPTLVCGNLMVTGSYGFRFHRSVSKLHQTELLTHATDLLIKKLKSENINPGLVIIKDFENLTHEDNFVLEDFTKFSVQPNMSMDIKSHWTTMEEYLFDLKSKYRVRYRKALQTTSHLIKKELNEEEIFQNQDVIFDLYKKISDQAKFNSFILDKSYFLNLKKNLGKKLQFISYWQEGNMVGFYTTLQHEQSLEAHFLGYDTELNKDIHLYLSMLYDMVHKAIFLKCKKINLSRTAIEIKSTIGAQPQDMFVLIKHTHKLINLSVGKVVNWVNPTENYIIRSPFKE